MPTPPPTEHPSALRELLAVLLSAAALCAVLLAWARSWHGASCPSPIPLLGATLGLLLGRWPRGRAQGLALFAVGATGLWWAPAELSKPAELLEFVLLGACGASAGACVLRAADRLGSRPTLLASSLGAGLTSACCEQTSSGVLLLLALASTAAAAWFSPPRGADPARSRRPAAGGLGPRAWTAAIALRAGVGLGVAACAFACLHEGGAPLGASLGIARALTPLAFGLALGLALSTSRLIGSPWSTLFLEPLGWALIAAVACWTPEWLGNDGRGVFWATLLGGALAGASLGAPLLRGGAWGLCALILAWPCGPWAFELGVEGWDGPAALALALDTKAGAELSEAASEEKVRLRFGGGGTLVQVVDLDAGSQRVRVMSIAGAVRAGAPTHAEQPRQVMSAPVLQAALPLLLAPEAPRRVALLGLDNGVTAGTALLSPAVEELLAIEPLAGVTAAHRDPGDLFGYINHRPLDDARLTLIRASFASWLRARGAETDVLLAGRVAPLPPFGPLTQDVPVVAWTVSRLNPEHMQTIGPKLWAFIAGDDALVLVSGIERIDLDRISERLDAYPRLRSELKLHGLDDPLAIVATLAAGPGGISEVPPAGLSPRAVQLAGATSFPGALDWKGEAAGEPLAKLAEQLALRMAPAALTTARAAVDRARTGQTLRVLGDVLRSAGRDGDALSAWRDALAADPRSVSTRLSLAVFHEKRREWQEGLDVLEPALGVDPLRDEQVQFHLGKLAMGAKDYQRARKHLRAAGSFRNAKDLLLLARQLSGPSAGPKLTPTQRLEAATRLSQRRKWEAAVEALLPLAHDPQDLSDGDQLRLAALLAELAASREPAARKLLRQLEADVLAKHAGKGDVGIDLRRALALAGAGEADAAERILADLLTSTASRPPEAYRVLGDVRMAREAWSGAIEAYERYLQLSPASSTHTRIYLGIADAARRLGRIDRALKALETAERLHPGHPRVRLNLGTLLWEQGRRGAAREAYEKYLEVAPPGDPMKERVEELLRTP